MSWPVVVYLAICPILWGIAGAWLFYAGHARRSPVPPVREALNRLRHAEPEEEKPSAPVYRAPKAKI